MNILQAVVRTLRQPDGTYELPDKCCLVQKTCFATLQSWWTVCCFPGGIEYWLNRALVWEAQPACPLGTDWGPDFGFATPEEAYYAWLQWLDGVEEG